MHFKIELALMNCRWIAKSYELVDIKMKFLI